MLKRFRFGGQDSITNPNPNIIRLTKNHESESEYSGFGGKDSNPNPNPNICYNTDCVVNVKALVHRSPKALQMES